VGRPRHRLGADVRPRHRGGPLLRLALQDAPGRGEPRRPAGPRQHAPRGHLDGHSRPSSSSACCFYAYLVLDDIEDAKANETQVAVVGQQFTWTFRYGEGDDAVVSNQLYVVEDQPVKFNIEARDVLHDFWVPQWRMKIDAVPGIRTEYRVTPNRRGEYPVVCAELCGIGHAYMRQTAHVVSQEEFDEWLAGMRDDGGSAGGGAAGAVVDGKTIFTDGANGATACGACHVLADAGTQGASGPDLDEALRGKDEAYVRESIVAPDKEITEGFGPGIMPKNYEDLLSPEELDALVKYVTEETTK
jgi:cytochrome c oxidase subunit 2